MSKMNKLPKVDLVLLKKLVVELESTLESCEKIKSEENFDSTNFTIEMCKSTGLITGIIQESSMLIGDLQTIVKASQQTSSKTADFLDKIMVGGLPHKGSGGSTN